MTSQRFRNPPVHEVILTAQVRTRADLKALEEVGQNAKMANYIKKLESRDAAEEPPAAGPGGPSDLPPASELVAEFEQFLRQQRPE